MFTLAQMASVLHKPRHRRRGTGLKVALSAAAIFAGMANAQSPVQYAQLFAMSSATGGDPQGGVTLDSAGNLYGATQLGGSSDNGTVFQLTPNSSGGWTTRTYGCGATLASGAGMAATLPAGPSCSMPRAASGTRFSSCAMARWFSNAAAGSSSTRSALPETSWIT